MNPRTLLAVSVAVNLILALYIVREATQGPPRAEEDVLQTSDDSAPPTATRESAKIGARATLAATPARTFTWESVESPDYREYIANLRAIGCPEETIRDIIVADVNKLYAAKKREARGEAKRFEYWKGGNPWMVQLDSDSLAETRALETEKLGVLRQLGIEPDAKMQMASLTDPMDAMGTLFGFLPEEKQVDVIKLMQDMQSEMAESASDGRFDTEALLASQKKMEAAIEAVLTPEEFREYELRMSTTANTMRNQLAGWDPDEQEFLEVFELRKAFDKEFSAYDRGNETDEERNRRQNAETQMNAAIEQALGGDRYEAYERAQDWTFQQINQAAKRADLGSVEAIQVYDMKQVAEEEARKVYSDPNLTQEQRLTALEGIQTETERSVQAVLGEEGWKQYNRGPNTFWLRNMVPRQPLSGTTE